jgi:hypothetical protein
MFSAILSMRGAWWLGRGREAMYFFRGDWANSMSGARGTGEVRKGPWRPVSAKWDRTPRKRKAVEALVIARTVTGVSKARIAEELRMDSKTVARVLSESEIEEVVYGCRDALVRLLPAAVQAVKAGLDAGDYWLALRLAELMGVTTGVRKVDSQPRILLNIVPAPPRLPAGIPATPGDG